MLWSQCGGRYCHVCYCRQWEAPSLPLCLKKTKPKQNSFSSMHTRECLASATEQHSCRVSVSIKWHARPLPRKILVPNTNHAPWLPSSVYSSRTALHPCSHLKDIKMIMIKSLTYCAGKSWDMLQSRCTQFPGRRECLISVFIDCPHLNEETSLWGLHGEPQARLWFGGKIVMVQAVGEIKNKGMKNSSW